MNNEYVLLGRSGLRISRLCLGTMTFGTDWGWGSAEETSHQIFNQYLDSGCNFIDTADGYTNGTSETLIGKFPKERGDRDRVFLQQSLVLDDRKAIRTPAETAARISTVPSRHRCGGCRLNMLICTDCTTGTRSLPPRK